MKLYAPILLAIGGLWVVWELKKKTSNPLGLTSSQFIQQTVLGPQLVDVNSLNPTGAAVPGFSQQPVDPTAVMV